MPNQWGQDILLIKHSRGRMTMMRTTNSTTSGWTATTMATGNGRIHMCWNLALPRGRINCSTATLRTHPGTIRTHTTTARPSCAPCWTWGMATWLAWRCSIWTCWWYRYSWMASLWPSAWSTIQGHVVPHNIHHPWCAQGTGGRWDQGGARGRGQQQQGDACAVGGC